MNHALGSVRETDNERDAVAERQALVEALPDNGHAVVLISHNMNDVFAVADRIAALYLGRMVAQVKASDVTHAQVVELITAGRSGNLGLPTETETSNGFDDNGVQL